MPLNREFSDDAKSDATLDDPANFNISTKIE
jgi:hypothetical protein